MWLGVHTNNKRLCEESNVVARFGRWTRLGIWQWEMKGGHKTGKDSQGQWMYSQTTVSQMKDSDGKLNG